MRELQFRLERFPATRRRLRRRLQPPTRPSLLLPLGGVVLLAAALSSHRDLSAPARAATVGGVEVRAERVLVLVDDSRSMAGAEDAVQAQLTRLRAAGISIANRTNVPGFAIAIADTFSLLPALMEGLAADRAIDAVYVISDFSVNDDAANDAVAIVRLSRVLRERRARIYWATVRDRPPATYDEIARQTGGGVIAGR